jgi:hypothetical protein
LRIAPPETVRQEKNGSIQGRWCGQSVVHKSLPGNSLLNGNLQGFDRIRHNLKQNPDLETLAFRRFLCPFPII